MATEIDELLAQALGRLGGPGARIVSRWLPPNVGEEQLELPWPRAELEPAVIAFLEAYGTPVALRDPSSSDGHSALVGSGRLRLNPAVVTVWLTEVAPGRTRLRVRGIAKEGWIKQRGGEQVAREIAAALGDPR